MVGVLGGCLTADVTLKADGSGTVEARFDPVLPTTAAQERSLFQGPGVRVETVEVGDEQIGVTGTAKPEWVRVRVAFKDVTKLSTVRRFERFKVTLTDADEGRKRLTASVVSQTHGKGFQHKDPVVIRVHLPGDVVESSAPVEGGVVTWSFPATDFVAGTAPTLQVTYKVSAAPGEGEADRGSGTRAPGETPAGAEPAEPRAERSAAAVVLREERNADLPGRGVRSSAHEAEEEPVEALAGAASLCWL
jgi:hypothetical protein